MKKYSIPYKVLALLLLLTIGGCSSPSSKGITSISDIATNNVDLIALGNESVPAGRYAKEVLSFLGIWEDIQGKISYATNVKEVLSQVELGSVSCGIVYATDAATNANVKVVEVIDSKLLSSPILYPVALSNASENPKAALYFLTFLTQEFARETFETNGFTITEDSLLYSKTTLLPDTLESCTITIFGAASLMESVTSIADEFMSIYPDITIITNFDSSGTLASQIEYGAYVDLFISASSTEIDALVTSGHLNKDTMLDLLENELVLITPKNKN